MFGRKKAAGNAGVGIILKVGSDGGLYVKSMQNNGPASNSRVVQVGDLLLEVSGKNAFGKSVDKVKMMILGVPETSCEFLFKRWLHGGDSTIYSIELIRTLAISAEDMNVEGPKSNPREAPSSPSSPTNTTQGQAASSHGEIEHTNGITASTRHDNPEALMKPETPSHAQARSLSPLNFLLQQGKAEKSGKKEGGIGIGFKVGKDGGLYVKSMLAEGAAFRSSLIQVGDCLMKIDGKNVFGKPVDKVVGLVLGTIGSVSQFGFKRSSSNLADSAISFSVMLTRGPKAERESVALCSPPNSSATPNRLLQMDPSFSAPSSGSTAVRSPKTLQEAKNQVLPSDKDSISVLNCALPSSSSSRLSDQMHLNDISIDAQTKVENMQDPDNNEQEEAAQELELDPEQIEMNQVQEYSRSKELSRSRSVSRSRSAASSPTEHVLKGRQELCEKPFSGGTTHTEIGEHNSRLRLTLARSLLDLQSDVTQEGRSLDRFSEELRCELATALSVSKARFRIDQVTETNSGSCRVDVEISNYTEFIDFRIQADEVDLLPLELSSGQLSLEIQRQVADPLSLLRNSTWFSFVMNVIIITTGSSSATTPVASRIMSQGVFSQGAFVATLADAHFGAPSEDAHFGAHSFGVPALFGQQLVHSLSPAILPDEGLHGVANDYGAPLENLWPASGFQVPFPSVLANERTGDVVAESAGRVLATEMENALDKLRQQAQKPCQVMSWLADHDLSANASRDSLQESSMQQLHRCASMPELHPSGTRRAFEAITMRLRLRLASREVQDAKIKQQNMELQQENEALRANHSARVSILEASEHRNMSEIKVLKGLSLSQTKEIEAFQMQNRSLATQLRDLKKKDRVQEKRPNNNLSEMFALEQQLQRERERVAQLMSALEQANVALARAAAESLASTAATRPEQETSQCEVEVEVMDANVDTVEIYLASADSPTAPVDSPTAPANDGVCVKPIERTDTPRRESRRKVNVITPDLSAPLSHHKDVLSPCHVAAVAEIAPRTLVPTLPPNPGTDEEGAQMVAQIRLPRHSPSSPERGYPPSPTQSQIETLSPRKMEPKVTTMEVDTYKNRAEGRARDRRESGGASSDAAAHAYDTSNAEEEHAADSEWPSALAVPRFTSDAAPAAAAAAAGGGGRREGSPKGVRQAVLSTRGPGRRRTPLQVVVNDEVGLH